MLVDLASAKILYEHVVSCRNDFLVSRCIRGEYSCSNLLYHTVDWVIGFCCIRFFRESTWYCATVCQHHHRLLEHVCYDFWIDYADHHWAHRHNTGERWAREILWWGLISRHESDLNSYYDSQKQEEYNLVFFITCGFYIVGIAIYGTFGTGKLQKWAVMEQHEDEPRQNWHHKGKWLLFSRWNFRWWFFLIIFFIRNKYNHYFCAQRDSRVNNCVLRFNEFNTLKKIFTDWRQLDSSAFGVRRGRSVVHRSTLI